jgi:pimeloyl-ACP methyl ester carboxylesterase
MSTKGYADTRNGQMHFVRAGRGPSLVLVPHAGRSSRMYSGLIEQLAASFNVISFDMMGTGRSMAPHPGWDISDHADCLLDAIDALGLTDFSIFGLHGGNKVALSLVTRHAARVQGFIYAGMSHSIIPSNAARADIFRLTPSISDVVSEDEAHAASPLMWARQYRALSGLWWDDAMAHPTNFAERAIAVEAAIESLEAFLHRPSFYRAAFAYDMENDLAQVRVPTLVLELTTPKEDRMVGRQGEAVAALIPGAQVHVIECEDSYAITLEDRTVQVAGIITSFLRKASADDQPAVRLAIETSKSNS